MSYHYYYDCWFGEEFFHDLKWLIPGKLAAGFTPEYSTHEPQWYYDANIRAILNVSGLVPEKSEPRFRELGMSYMFNKTDDGDCPNLSRSIKFIDKNIKRGKPVFVHCFGGVGRTGTVLAAYLLHKGQFKTAAEAIRHVRNNYHPGAVETFKQKSALEEYANRSFWSKIFSK